MQQDFDPPPPPSPPKPSSSSPPSPSHHHSSHPNLPLALGLTFGVCFFLFFAGLIFGRYLFKVRRVLRLQAELSRRPDRGLSSAGASSSGKQQEQQQDSEYGFAEMGLPTRYSFLELSYATRGFSSGELLGEGGFGSVYKGYLPPGETQVAVKRLSESSKQGEREFMAEVSTIGRLRHRNLVHLKGWCYENARMLLVYEYMPKGSLDKVLFPPSSVLSWPQRYKIAKGVSAGLAYLHEGWDKRVIHRDVKPSNVLLDHDFEPRITDFGLARLIDHRKAGRTMTPAGTPWYYAPELQYTRWATDKSDVYSFGVVLLALASGMQATDRRLMIYEEHLLVNWVWRMHESGNLLAVADERLRKGGFNEEEMVRVLQLGLFCSFPNPDARPTMRFCERVLHGDAAVPALPPSKPSPFSTVSFTVDFPEDGSLEQGILSASASATTSTSAAAPLSDFTNSEISSTKVRSSSNSESSEHLKLLAKRSSSADFIRRDEPAADHHLPLIRHSSLREK